MNKLYEVKAVVKCLGEKQTLSYTLPTFLVEAEHEIQARVKGRHIVGRWGSASITSVEEWKSAYRPN